MQAVYLGGLASLQSHCETGNLETYALANGLPCSKTYRFYWFIMRWGKELSLLQRFLPVPTVLVYIIQQVYQGGSYVCIRDFTSPLSCVLTSNSLLCCLPFCSWELVVVLGMIFAAVTGKLASMKTSFIGLFAVGTLLYIDASNMFLTAQSDPDFEHDTPLHRIRTITGELLALACEKILGPFR